MFSLKNNIFLKKSLRKNILILYFLPFIFCGILEGIVFTLIIIVHFKCFNFGLLFIFIKVLPSY